MDLVRRVFHGTEYVVELGRSVVAQEPERQVLRLSFGVWGFGSGIWGLGFGVWCLGFGVWGLGSGVRGLGFGVLGS